MSSTTIYICHKLGKMLTVHYILKIYDKFIWNDLKVKETYLRFLAKRQTLRFDVADNTAKVENFAHRLPEMRQQIF